jgi:hypothetical protein
VRFKAYGSRHEALEAVGLSDPAPQRGENLEPHA